MKILYTASVLSHICQFHLPMMEMLQQQGWAVHVAARNNLAEKSGLQLKFCDKLFEMSFQRSPKNIKNLYALKQLKNLFDKEYYDIILCNTPVCSILTRIAARKTRKKGTKVIYMAHGFHFYNGAPLKLWLIYPIEKYFADRDTDLLITINEEDYERARRQFKCKTARIHGVGVKSDRYHTANEAEQREMREREGLLMNDFVIICTGELLRNKNQKALIRAVGLCKDKIPNIKLLLAGNGQEKEKHEEMINELGLSGHVWLLGYRTDLEKVVPCVNLVTSASIREGLGLNIIEGMMCAKPVVASRNRGHDELINDGDNGFLVDARRPQEFADKFIWCYMHDCSEMEGASLRRAQPYIAGNQKQEFIKILQELFN